MTPTTLTALNVSLAYRSTNGIGRSLRVRQLERDVFGGQSTRRDRSMNEQRIRIIETCCLGAKPGDVGQVTDAPHGGIAVLEGDVWVRLDSGELIVLNESEGDRWVAE